MIPGGDRQRRNRELIAERLGWPDGALTACLALEEEFPGWAVYWAKGGLPRDPHPGYRAFRQIGWHQFHHSGNTVEELRDRLAAAGSWDAER